jgi:hypothetical protein
MLQCTYEFMLQCTYEFMLQCTYEFMLQCMNLCSNLRICVTIHEFVLQSMTRHYDLRSHLYSDVKI